MSKRIIISASSDIGTAIGQDWMAKGHDLIGTYRTDSPSVVDFRHSGAMMIHCDLTSTASVERSCGDLVKAGEGWDTLVFTPGSQDPVALFSECDFAEWASSITVNFTAQLQIVHSMLPFRDQSGKETPSVIFFAGGGTNRATKYYSAYTISKIALIKMCELLDEEIPDVKFTIIGPGWVKTKIHQSTLNAKESAGVNFELTEQKLNSDECVPMEQVVKCVDWAISSALEVVGGRNVSLVFDKWGDPELDRLLRKNPDMYKLRRQGNDVLPRTTPISERSHGK